MNKFIIQDCFCNTLQFTGRFNFATYGQDLGTPKVFKTCEDAECYLEDLLGDEYEDTRGEFYIEPKTGV